MIFQGLIFLKRILKMYQVTNQSNIRSSIHSEDLIFLYLSLAIKTNLIILQKKNLISLCMTFIRITSHDVTIKKDGHVIVKVEKPFRIHSYFDIYNICISFDMVGW